MTNELFADDIGNIAVTGTLVRMDLVSLGIANEGEQPRLEFRQRIVMPLDGFLRAFDTQRKVVDALLKEGVISTNPSPPADAPSSREKPQDAPTPLVSPNFS
ncbi:MAG: hypothetical protein Q7T25_07100 [Sideroxyarcus sp.]|nr:hypothetical protein [Sideroxyarcus sp.]